MKKRTIFLLVLLSFIAYIVLYRVFVPKVIFINQSGYDIYIFGYYVDDREALRKKYPADEPLKVSSVLLTKDEEINYSLGFFSNKGRESSFWASWYFPDKRRNDGAFVQNRMVLPKEDFGWKNVIFIIDENGNYHKLDKNTK